MIRQMMTYGTIAVLLFVGNAMATTDTASNGGGTPDKGKINLVVNPSKVFVNDTVELTATLTPPEYLDENDEIQEKSVDDIDIGFSHSTTTIQNPTGPDGVAIVHWDPTQTGEFDVSASVPSGIENDYNPSSDTETVTVVGGDLLLVTSDEYLPVDENVTLTGKMNDNPPGDTTFTFYVDDHEIHEETTAGRSVSFDYPEDADDPEHDLPMSPGERRFRVEVDGTEPDEGESDEPDANEADVTWVGVEKVIVADSDPEDEGPAYVVVDEEITLEAIPTPDDVEFPTGSPAWEITDKPEGSQVSDPSEGSAIVTFTPDEPGEYVIEAACGESSAAFTVVGFTVDKIVLYGRRDVVTTQRDEGEDRFWFDQGEQVMFRAAITPNTGAMRSALRDRFKWSLDPVAGVTGNDWEPNPYWGDGLHAKGVGASTNHSSVSLRVLPSNNDGFGEKELTLEVVDSDIEETATARLFFERTGNHHPNPGHEDTANWYYYWSQEGAGEGQPVCMFSRQEVDWAAAHPDDEDEDTIYGAYFNDQIYIFDVAVTHGPWDFTFPEGDGEPDWVSFTIDADSSPAFVNVTYAHEKTHEELESAFSDNPGLVDSDQDGVPDSWEEDVPGMETNTEESFEGEFSISEDSDASDDAEFYCVLGGAFSPYGETVDMKGMTEADYKDRGVIPVQANEDSDWSTEGPQWE
ncbi:MAG: hypothetical protein WD534_18210 [Phycisphaeraceae bacterium]